ncbi:MAG: proteasome subunit alpha [Armatimonadetes bacterium]|nr:proteasome subunit alpha [Armatimonadota bacterium]
MDSFLPPRRDRLQGSPGAPDPAPSPPDLNEPGRPGDFLRLLAESGTPLTPPAPSGDAAQVQDTHGTTVIAVKYRDGVINVGDRRATAGNYIMYDRAEKIVPVSDNMLIGISGSYARAMEILKYLQTSFKYYERSQLQPLSLEGQLHEITRVMQQNIQMAMSGIGAFIPIVSAWDRRARQGRIYFYDGMGGRFETPEYAAAGSGSERIRGVFEYIVKTKGRFSEMDRTTSLQDALALLEIAADLDSATGGSQKILPVVKILTADGVETLPDEEIMAARDAIADAGFAPGVSETDLPNASEDPHGV